MAKPVVLTVDDDPSVLSAVARDLRKQYGSEFRVMKAESGPVALDLLLKIEERSEPVALLISDQRMPGMDGVAFLTEAAKHYPRSKRALLTAYADTDAAIGAINESRVDYYLLKPWDPPEEKLYPILDDLLDDWRASYKPGFGGLRILGDRWSPRGHKVRDFLARNHVPYQFIDVESSREGKQLVESTGIGPGDLPLVIFADGSRLSNPEPVQVAEKIGLSTQAKELFYDLAIVGAGPAGLASAVYGGSEGLDTVLVEGEAPGGQAGTSSRIENYLGFPSGLSGGDLARRAVVQAKRFGVEILTPQRVESLLIDGPYKQITLSDGSKITSHVLMLSMGVSWNLLPAEGADRLTGAGVYYGASAAEAVDAGSQAVYLIGGGNSAGQAAIFLSDHVQKVVILIRGGSIRSKMSEYLVTRIEERENIEVRLWTEVKSCRGSDHLEAIELMDRASGECEVVPAQYLFVFLGAAPQTEWLGGIVATDERGFILTGPSLDPEKHLKDWPLERAPYLLETNVPGIFAAGDARFGSVKRVASAVGEGSVAVYFMHEFLSAR